MTPSPQVVHLTLSAVRCPFAGAGLDSAEIAACPAYEASRLEEAPAGPGAAITGTTCGHLTVRSGGRGFIPACDLPGGPPAMPAVAAGTMRTARRDRSAAS